MQREIDRLFDDFVPSRESGNGDRESAVWSPRVDLSESEDAYVVHVDAPGMKKDDFNINWQNDTLTVSGERKWSGEASKENFVRVERSYGHFFRSFRLPKAIDGDQIQASYDAGVLTVTVPKAEESKPRRIEIQ
ncbi:MAG: Hsp20/alpha crystallin family protein [Rhodothermales bacterium]